MNGAKVNTLIDENYYELLDLKPGATDSEIEEAYERIKRNYSENSIAVHSLFSPNEKKDIFEKATKAYEALKAQNTVVVNNLRKVDNNHKEGKEVEINLHDNQGSTFEVQRDYNAEKGDVKIKKPLVVLDDPKSLAAEQYRFLCTKLEQISANKKCKVFAVTSAVKDEGKSTTSINLAYLMAHEFKKKVLLVDGDLRSPSMPDFFETTKKYGLPDILTGRSDTAAAFCTLLDKNLTFLPSTGAAKSTPTELLSSPNMKRLVSSFKAQFDYVLIDSPPVLPVADVNILSEIVDGLLFVVKAGKTPKDLVLKAIKSIPSDKIVGIILNGAETSSMKYSKYYGC